MKINGIDGLNSLTEINKGLKNKKDNSFSELLMGALDKVNQMQVESDQMKKLLAIGEVDNLHDVTIATEKANVAFQVTMSIRSKIVEAYKEIMRMQF